MEIVEGGVEEETIQALKNMHMIFRKQPSYNGNRGRRCRRRNYSSFEKHAYDLEE